MSMQFQRNCSPQVFFFFSSVLARNCLLEDLAAFLDILKFMNTGNKH